ncbi:hypothetical protein FIBSPDRAFT_1005082 [Athelia psychrophila]|uniref:Uncharacterized protein n=1 Tax=Athelia psychrophila TaxID=1759441 RepID=A0A166PRJ9_9AGAM|nr:hypothetical protein FIBSPDRAFT_1005082 [Fibularhizoctonia sp. CBS 109695]
MPLQYMTRPSANRIMETSAKSGFRATVAGPPKSIHIGLLVAIPTSRKLAQSEMSHYHAQLPTFRSVSVTSRLWLPAVRYSRVHSVEINRTQISPLPKPSQSSGYEMGNHSGGVDASALCRAGLHDEAFSQSDYGNLSKIWLSCYGGWASKIDSHWPAGGYTNFPQTCPIGNEPLPSQLPTFRSVSVTSRLWLPAVRYSRVHSVEINRTQISPLPKPSQSSGYEIGNHSEAQM